MSAPSAHRPGRYADLQRIATASMTERGLQPEFSAAVQRQVEAIRQTPAVPEEALPDLRALLWCSIDNDDSRDLDQLTVAEALPDGATRVWVAIADVDSLVPKGSAIDEHACFNTTSVYTSARVFTMLPEALSYDLTSLNPAVDRLAVVTEMVIHADASLHSVRLYRARVHNQAQLAYDAVAAWLEGQGPLPEAAARVSGMEQQLRLQDQVAQTLRRARHAQGSLALETFQPRAVFDAGQLVGIEQQVQNRARQLIEELMIATNTCTAHFLARHSGRSLRRVVRSPERWMRIMEVAAQYGETLPGSPDSRALEAFLARRHTADPLRFPDLSLVIVKLMGSGEYVVEQAGQRPLGHFGLALRDYTHSTAPNRRFPDLITQRMVKAALAHQPMPYSDAELQDLAQHCTRQEDASRKVERKLRKCEAALYLERFVGQSFDALVTGTEASATWVRLLSPPVEGRLIGRLPPLRVGQLLRVELKHTDVERGFIDFALQEPEHGATADARPQARPHARPRPAH
ncbi:RNB domain-containing ribonuclease [Curvibacter gracilis]|uniref:RNB domain-containing ribonuclease n=1 Tax=Curvibacter gracilis TaxID=230310 RepID=UPI000488C279|nr:RNB domain-containing ribonuclease [Curvibacter gracilis]